MEKLYSQIVGTFVITEDQPLPVARVFDMIIDPENGKVIALSLHHAAKRVITPVDVRAWLKQIVIADEDVISESSEVLRVRDVLRKHIPVLRNRVETKSGVYLGRVFDYMVNLNLMTLTKLYVAKSLFGLVRIGTRVISAKDILQIKADRIIVKNDVAKEAEVVRQHSLEAARG